MLSWCNSQLLKISLQSRRTPTNLLWTTPFQSNNTISIVLIPDLPIFVFSDEGTLLLWRWLGVILEKPTSRPFLSLCSKIVDPFRSFHEISGTSINAAPLSHSSGLSVSFSRRIHLIVGFCPILVSLNSPFGLPTSAPSGDRDFYDLEWPANWFLKKE